MPSKRKHPPYEYLTSRWGGMDIREEFGYKIEKWLSLFEEKDRPILIELLKCFQYYSEKKISSKVKELFQLFEKVYSADLGNIVFSKPAKDFGTSFSNIFFISFWLNNGIKDNSEDNIIGLFSEGIVPPVVAIVDDYSGSGQTFIKTMNTILAANSQATQTTFYFLVLSLSEDAEQIITKYADLTGLCIRIIALERVPNAFKPGYIFDESQIEEKLTQYNELYDRFALKPEYKHGFFGVASLVSFHYNTPNNTLGLFWQDLSEFCALFPRHKTTQTTLRKMQSDARTRRQGRGTVAIYGLDEGRRSAMMVYCVSQEDGFSLMKMKDRFGVTEKQLDADLKALLDRGFLEYKNNQFFPTVKLKSHMFISRLEKIKKEKRALPEKPSFSPHEEYIPLNFD